MGQAANKLRGWYQIVRLKFVVPPWPTVVGLVVLSVMERRDRLAGEHVTTAASRCPEHFKCICLRSFRDTLRVLITICVFFFYRNCDEFVPACANSEFAVPYQPGGPPWERKVEWRSRSRVQQPLLPFPQRKWWSWFLNYYRVGDVLSPFNCFGNVEWNICLLVFLPVCLCRCLIIEQNSGKNNSVHQ